MHPTLRLVLLKPPSPPLPPNSSASPRLASPHLTALHTTSLDVYHYPIRQQIAARGILSDEGTKKDLSRTGASIKRRSSSLASNCSARARDPGSTTYATKEATQQHRGRPLSSQGRRTPAHPLFPRCLLLLDQQAWTTSHRRAGRQARQLCSAQPC